MATTIVNPSGSNPMGQIDNAFSSVYSMFGSPSKGGVGGGTGPFGITPQPVSGSDNSLTAFFRGLSNLLGAGSTSALNAGGNLLGTGTGVAQGGLDIAGTGLPVINTGVGTMGTGLETLQPSIDFYNKILSGDPRATTEALAPTAANIAAITSGATTNASQGLPAGGYRASTLAGLPFAQAAQVGNAALALQPAAAQALEQLGGEQAQIGQEQVGAGTAAGNLGLGISQTGLGLGQLGQGLTAQGFQALESAVQDMLSKMGINIQGGTANLFSTVVGSL